MDSQKARPGIQTGIQSAELDLRGVAVDGATDSQRAEMGLRSEETSAQLFSHAGAGPIDAQVNTPIDAWPEQGISIWPDHTRHAPLLPPLPVPDQRSSLGWILEWPVGWLRDTPLRRISLAPLRRISLAPLRRISLRPRMQTQPRTQPRTPTRPDLTRQRSPTRPDLQAHLARTSIPLSQHRLAQRPYPSRVSVPVPKPRRYPRKRPYLAVALLLLLTLAGAGFLVTEQSGFDLVVPLDSLHTLIGTGESASPSTNPSVLSAPALGSEADAFAARFGGSAPSAVGDATAQYNTRIAGQSVALRVEFGIGMDRFEHVVTINASDPTLQGWEAATADTICMTFLPHDAQLHSFAHVAGQTEYIYTSAGLAALFPPASFTNDNDELVARGTFNRLDQPAHGTTNGVLGCTLALGQHTLK